MTEIILDTETTGLSSSTDKIIEIACIELDNHTPTGKKFHTFINPEMNITDGAYQTHGITRDFLNDKPKFKEVAKEFLDFIKDSTLVIHNADFDLAFLNKELKDVDLKVLSKERVVDTLFIARDKFPGQQNSLDALCKRFKIDNSRREKHSALLDCDLLTKVYIDLLDKKEPTFDLSVKDTNTSNKDIVELKNRKRIIVEISEEEEKEHKNFLKKNIPKSFIFN
ncbi:MAG: DNA polymerase III subunit epsilon [Candidatus Pelagibacter sp.]|nr:DNA polymerase III subunit epsilon [Candidatus Pelagibacter sp.]|tara:strand:- start:37960 stop:38631 length:672 start_codon:yes stop_codon:yes gene_type:complete